jgi:hypothetical protein
MLFGINTIAVGEPFIDSSKREWPKSQPQAQRYGGFLGFGFRFECVHTLEEEDRVVWLKIQEAQSMTMGLTPTKTDP